LGFRFPIESAFSVLGYLLFSEAQTISFSLRVKARRLAKAGVHKQILCAQTATVPHERYTVCNRVGYQVAQAYSLLYRRFSTCLQIFLPAQGNEIKKLAD
jgi:hypothetical protein